MTSALRPWLGLASFTEAEAGRFFGREEELAELLRRVQRKRLTVLFGQSGLGKTSLLQAGLGPRAQAVGLLPVRVRMDYAPEAPTPAEQIKRAIEQAAQGCTWTRPGVAKPGESLWAFLHHRDDALHDASGRVLMPLLVLDQFEEVFTLAQADAARRQQAERFLTELADLVENRVPAALEAAMEQDDEDGEQTREAFDFGRDDYRVLISLREDYLAPMETLKGRMPAITQNRLRLEPLRGAQALQAVRGPAPELVDEATAVSLLRYVAGAADHTPVADLRAEPSLLSLFLYELNEQRIARDEPTISTELLAGSQAHILRDFYERSLADQPEGVRRFVEDVLLTDTGYRDNVAEERARQALAAAGAAPDALDELVNRRLLRLEERLDQRRVELTHDVLCAVVRASRDNRREREQLAASQAALAAQQATAKAQRRQLVRARQVAAGSALLALIAAGAGTWAWAASQRAAAAEGRASEARTRAEGLVGFLLDDFYDELQPLGRLDVLQRLSQQVIDTYAELPASLQDDASRRGLALAQVRHAQALVTQARTADAEALLRQALASLEALYARGDRSEAMLVGLIQGLRTEANLRFNARLTDAKGILEPLTRAQSLAGDAANQPGASQALRRSLAQAMVYRAFIEYQQVSDSPAAERSARAAFRLATPRRGEPSGADLRRQLGAITRLVPTLAAPGRLPEAQAAAVEGLALADRLLALRKDDATAIEARAELNSNLALAALVGLDPAAALAPSEASRADYATLAERDPSVARFRNNEGAAVHRRSGALAALGRPRDALAALQQAVAALKAYSGPGNFSLSSMGNLGIWTEEMLILRAELGDQAGARATWQQLEALGWQGGGSVPPHMREGHEFLNRVTPFLRALAEDDAVLLAAPSPLQHGGDSKDRDVLMPYRASLLQLYAQAALRLERWPVAEASLAEALRVHDFVVRGRQDITSFSMPLRIELAWVQARLGRLEDARESLAPALADLARLKPLSRSGVRLDFLQAQAQVVQSLLEPAQASQHLRDARRTLAALPPQMQELRNVKAWRRWAGKIKT